ncbi:hypothetical protein C1645_875382 [Glomus cerebriforme]|uniref:Uncharacterized protein n=1 Tax=Glomus cerebriforme TaxID=658196 RepID=A0A397T909_9GLOM|nr:hypothetical protein C1645_875382 [Glomus cerebriforme]
MYNIGVIIWQISSGYRLFHPEAENENEVVQHSLGERYMDDIDLEKAIYWYQKAAEKGDKITLYNLEVNEEKALKLYEKGYEFLQCNLAKCYQLGITIEKFEVKTFNIIKNKPNNSIDYLNAIPSNNNVSSANLNFVTNVISQPNKGKITGELENGAFDSSIYDIRRSEILNLS